MQRIHQAVGFMAVGILAFFAPAALGAEKTDIAGKPERLILMAPEYPGVITAPGKEISMDLSFINRGRTDETLDVQVTQTPKGWKTKIKTYRYVVTGVHVPADDKKSLTFEALPEKEVPPGDYAFVVEAQTRDGRFKISQKINVTLAREQEGPEKDQGVNLTTSYPVIRGPSDAAFEFSVEVDSRLDKEAIFDLFAQGPKGWDFNFKPAYETKFISSIRLKANQSQTIAVEVKPALNSPAGEYSINLRVSSGDAKAEANLTVILTGTYALDAGTSSGLLSLEARQGMPANVSFFVKNTGSAVNHDIKFMTFKPENWKVEFQPERIDQIEPNGLKQSEARIEQALADVGLADEESSKKIAAFSRGMRQRLGIAELLIKDARVAFLDEPTLGLDPDATQRVTDLIQRLAREQRMTVLLSSHQLHQVQRICDRVGIMIKGRMVANGPIDQLAREKFGLDREEFTWVRQS